MDVLSSHLASEYGDLSSIVDYVLSVQMIIAIP
jgi:hypothetical protein